VAIIYDAGAMSETEPVRRLLALYIPLLDDSRNAD
jgi:hypothetical protein